MADDLSDRVGQQEAQPLGSVILAHCANTPGSARPRRTDDRLFGPTMQAPADSPDCRPAFARAGSRGLAARLSQRITVASTPIAPSSSPPPARHRKCDPPCSARYS